MGKGTNALQEFLAKESAGGILLAITAVLAMILANSPLSGTYELLLNVPVTVRIGTLLVDKPLLLWVNDGLMAIFFFLIGLELKREFVEGELREPRNLIMPGIGAIGGMVVPALVYVALNQGGGEAMRGWAIPAATDIAFALGVLSLLGSRVPISLKVFLTTLAIIDDVGAILIIALFYSSEISLNALAVAGACVVVLALFNKRKITSTSLYMFVGVVMWTATLKSGIHATIAGVLLAFFIPLNDENRPGYSPLKSLEHNLHHTVSFIILPIFAFFNAGVNLSGMSIDQFIHPVPLGVALGLFLGKQFGVFGFCYAVLKLGWAKLPPKVSMVQLYATCILTGIGFTMSLFIGSLAFQGTSVNQEVDERIGIIMGSLLSGIFGYILLAKSSKAEPEQVPVPADNTGHTNTKDAS